MNQNKHMHTYNSAIEYASRALASLQTQNEMNINQFAQMKITCTRALFVLIFFLLFLFFSLIKNILSLFAS